MISNEWAKQLAFDVLGNLDFASIRVTRVPDNVREYHLPIYPNCISWKDDLDSDVYDLPEVEEVKLELVFDSLNSEYTSLGYGPKTNVLLIGPTRKNEANP